MWGNLIVPYANTQLQAGIQRDEMSCTGTEIMHDLEEACKDVDIAVLLSGISPKRSHEDFVQESRAMYSLLGRALNDHASENVKVGASAWHA